MSKLVQQRLPRRTADTRAGNWWWEWAGGRPAISVNPASVDFVSIPVDSPATQVIEIWNKDAQGNPGKSTLRITLPITTPAGFTVTVDPATSIAPGASTTFTLRADAGSVAVFSGNISIQSNAASSPTLVAVTANVTIITSGLVAWYDADYAAGLWEDSARTVQAADNADVIGAWDDRSGNGYHVIQATTGNKPTLRTNVQNGKSVIRFDGSDDVLEKTSFPDFGDNYTVLMVLKESSGGDTTQVAFEVATAITNSGFSSLHVTSVNLTWRGRDATVTRDLLGGNYRDNVARIHRMLNTGTQLKWSVNNVALTPVAYTAPNPSTLNRLSIGQLVGGGGYNLNGDMPEILIYSRTLTGAEETAMENYFNAKWAVY